MALGYTLLPRLAAMTARLFDEWRLAFLVAAAAGTIAGIPYHLLFEKPALRLLGGRPRRAGEHPGPRTARRGAGLTRL